MVSKSELTATGGLTYNSSTGVLTSDGTAGSLTLEFASPVDLRNLFHFNVTNSGATGDILTCLEFYDEDNTKINTWNSIKLSNLWNPNGIDDNATNAFLNNKPVKKLVWQSNANASNNGKTATITSVEFICKTIACSKAGETQLNTLPWNLIDDSGTAKPDWNMNGSSDTYYGNYSGDPTHYADLTDYEELRVYCKDNNTGFRCFFINEAGNGIVQINTAYSTWNSEKKYYSLDLSTIVKWNDKVALKAIKAENGGGPGEKNVTNIVAFKTPASNAPQYILTGSGMQLAETVAALADETVTSIDATGVKGITTNSEKGRTLLESTNPNCLFLGKVGNGYLANTKNVIDGDVCANLELVDGQPFKAPVAFTATNALFEKTVTAAGYATLVLPFNADVAEGVEAYNIESESAGVLTTTVAEAIVANKPVMIKAVDASYSFKADDVAVPATPAGAQQNGLLYGVYETTDVPTTNGYVLQKHDAEVNFYKAATGQKVNAFRAYLATAAGARELSFDFNTTGVNGVKMNSENAEVYNLNGQRVAAPQKGLYIVGAKKVIVK